MTTNLTETSVLTALLLFATTWFMREPSFYRAGCRCWNCGDLEDRRQLWRFVRRFVFGWFWIAAGFFVVIAVLALAIGFLRG